MSRKCTITLRNDTPSSNLFVTITGRAIERHNDPVFISADGCTPFYPTSPSSILQPVGHDVAIPVGGPGSTKVVEIPLIAGGRIWYCKDTTLKFLLNPGPAVVEPSMMNPSDENHFLDWGFAEFTFNEAQLFVNISYVDFVSIPVSLTLENKQGKVSVVKGLPTDGLDQICKKLIEQDAKDHAGWSKLVVKTKDGSRNLRALSANSGCVIFPGLFGGYLEPAVNQIWDHYIKNELTINTQASWGDVKGNNCDGKGHFVFQDLAKFAKPSTADIFSCSTGPFARTADYTEGKGAVGARLAAALNRGTLLTNCTQPENEKVENYYTADRTNHFARVCHEVSLGGRGYAFPYDDVGPSGGIDQSGSLWDGEPKMLTVGIGGWKGN